MGMAATPQGVIADISTFDAPFLPDAFSTGELRIEMIGPNARLTFYSRRSTSLGDVLIPAAPVIVPQDTLMLIAQKLAAAVTLARRDLVGTPIGAA